ncbi:poly-beta-1,6-N-acetyl-D-glucosamine N-deacetylase PgaB [Oleiagrimonas sp.]|uniref:poly-beta-1,6-N-acetyl-D-glucosamine N-deacetylase PgaB n=1 Tax=Oleiagrimonas sp. TaxID=2010330 RepID=UPI00262A5683|nr:poly-beta-1,6-N-acetyl-D-glucosamine N-deacetylase PgaB [Oleiagrimonas sp.]MDA3914919.1 poly-beta-1,6-N-acetyl-D-glucosamine N-deacetylase PgaB [Oleiagrimonas sp.]
MRRLLLALLLLIALPAHAGRLVILSYHDVFTPADGPITDPDAISLDHFVGQLDYLHAHGWTPISAAQLRASMRGGPALPDKAVMLTFDDGMESFYTRVYPLLQAYHAPALLAVVDHWIDQPKGTSFNYNGKDCSSACFVTWAQIREMRASGLVEIASHTDNLHHGIIANPQGNKLPPVIARRYDRATGTYETRAQWRQRIRADLTRSVREITRRAGAAPKAIVWPYGAYNQQARKIAADLGMTLSLTLGDGTPRPRREQTQPRQLLGGNTSVQDLEWMLRKRKPIAPVRAVQVDLDYVYDPDPAQQERNLSRLLDRIKRMHVTQVWLQAYADPDGDGVADAVYFPNRHLPMRADLFSRVAWQLQTRCQVHVYAWMPVLAFKPRKGDPVGRMTIGGDDGDVARLDPSRAPVRRWIGELYTDLASHAAFDGLLFSDDALLREGDRLHQAPPPGPARTRWLIDFTHQLAARVRQWQPQLRVARNLFARPVLHPEAEKDFAQSLPAFVRAYDEIGLMAMPQLDHVQRARSWLKKLARVVQRTPGASARTVFELAARDWRSRKPIPAARMRARMHLLQVEGALHLAYYPDDFLTNHPALEHIRPDISAATYPYKER